MYKCTCKSSTKGYWNWRQTQTKKLAINSFSTWCFTIIGIVRKSQQVCLLCPWA